jgi:2'-5' RNA ligase
MAFLGIKVPNDIGRLLSEIEIPGEKVSRDTMHVTILYVGKETPIEQLVKVILAAYGVTSQTKPFTVETRRVSAFSPNPDDGVPIIALVESPALHNLKDALCAAFDASGVEYNKKYPVYRPHVTLGYTPDAGVFAEQVAEKDIVPGVEWGVGEMVLWGGDSGDEKLTVTFPFSMQMTREAVYRAVVRLVTAHDENGHCQPTCPCHTQGHPPDEAQRVVARYLAKNP